jgi:hypothetical protein
MKEYYSKDIASVRKKDLNKNPTNKNPLNQIKMWLKATQADWNKWKTKLQDLKTKLILKIKQKNS